MLRSYLKIGWRNLKGNLGYSTINIAGLAAGMAVAILIGLWIYDELTFNKYYENYDRIAQVMQHNIYNGVKASQEANPYLMAEEIRNNFGSDFKYVLQASWNNTMLLSAGEKKLNKTGNYFEPGVTEMLSLKMIRGSRDGLKDPNSILLSESVAKAFFGDDDPVGQLLRVDNKTDVKVTGVYEDFPENSTFNTTTFLLPWKLNLITRPWIEKMEDPWGSNFTQTFAQVADNADMEAVSARIKDVKLKKVSEGGKRYQPEVFLHPMSKWHLYSDFKNGKISGGRIEFVWLFGTIGMFVLLLACINFMNLSTARSEKRAKEVGIRKAIGSVRTQLVGQFFSESLLVVSFAFVLSLVIARLSLPFFNEVAGKEMSILWFEPLFWIAGISFSLLTGIIAGSYPALYLSSFQAVQVLKGTFKAGRLASLPRKVLVVIQFTVSVTLIIGTIIVYRQIQYAKNRPIGYDRSGLITMMLSLPEIHNHFEAVRQELISAGAIVDMAESGSPLTGVWNTNGDFDWPGKDPALAVDFPNNEVTHEYGKTVGWELVDGRDFSREFVTDSDAFVINEAAASFMGLKNPVNEIIKWNGQPYKIIGIVKNLVIQSPYMPPRPNLYHISSENGNVMILRINPSMNVRDAIAKVEEVFKRNNPSEPFEYKFVDDEFARKFDDEERVGKLATAFGILAIFISCLGIFGLASFVAEQRTKEIGVRKVMGATVMNVWGMLSRDFVFLVVLSCIVAMPISWYFLNQWLLQFEYRTGIALWVFGVTAVGALIITLLTVSFQAVKAGMANPVKSLRSE